MINPTLLNLPMPIKTPRIVLRPPQPGDGAIVNAAIIESFHELHAFMPWAQEIPLPVESEEFVRQAAANWIVKKNEEPYLPLFMFDIKTGEFIGATGYHHINWNVPCLETGYWIRTSYSGKGLMTEAINALTQYAFKELQVKRIAITCDITNTQSKKIPERLGYTLEGIMKCDRRTMTGELSDTLKYARYNADGLPELEISW